MNSALFPGQGSQYVGMGRDFFDEFSVVRDLFQEAEDALSLSLRKLMFDGDEDTLRQTRYAQPSLFLVGACIVRVMEDIFGTSIPKHFGCVAGHSLGEYTALYAARSLSFSHAIKLIKRRCEAMRQVHNGGMVAVLGLSPDQVHNVVKSIKNSGGVCEVSNENSPQQTVVSGKKGCLEKVAIRSKEAGASKVVTLNVSGPFHCSLMQPAQDAFVPFVRQEKLGAPVCPVITNVSGRPQTDPDTLVQHLETQITRPVLWVQTQQALVDLGVSQCVEIGPGRVLAGLARKTIPQVQTLSIGSVEALKDNLVS